MASVWLECMLLSGKCQVAVCLCPLAMLQGLDITEEVCVLSKASLAD